LDAHPFDRSGDLFEISDITTEPQGRTPSVLDFQVTQV